MKIQCFLFLLMLFFSITWAQAANKPEPEVKKGVLIYFPKIEGLILEPGQILSYIETGDNFKRISLVIDGKKIDYSPIIQLFPADPSFAPSRIWILLSSDEYPLFSQERKDEITWRYQMLKNICRNFPDHPLHEELLAMLITESELYNRYVSDPKTGGGPTREFLAEYLKKYPRGHYSDEFRWRMIMLENFHYEYEGDPRGPLEEIKAYEKFLKENQHSKVADQVRLKIAILYRIASECIGDSDEQWLNSELFPFGKEDEKRFHDKAVAISKQLLKSEDLHARETARVNLFNMEQGRKCYAGDNQFDW